MRSITLLTLALTLSACGTPAPTLIVMKHPTSGDIVQCRGSMAYAAGREAASCAAAYQGQGYERISR